MWPFKKKERAATWEDVARIRMEYWARSQQEDRLFDEWYEQNKHRFEPQSMQVITGGAVVTMTMPTHEQREECLAYIAARMPARHPTS